MAMQPPTPASIPVSSHIGGKFEIIVLIFVEKYWNKKTTK
jgi:hypothetical protein